MDSRMNMVIAAENAADQRRAADESADFPTHRRSQFPTGATFALRLAGPSDAETVRRLMHGGGVLGEVLLAEVDGHPVAALRLAEGHVVAAPAPSGDEAASEEGLGMLQRWMAMASGKWSLPILDHLAARPSRYNRLLAALESVAPKVLTQTLRRLETEGFVASEPIGKAGRMYSLTQRGAQLREQLGPLRRWAAQEALTGTLVTDLDY